MADLIEREPLLEKMFPCFEKKLVREAPAVNRWIPCSERLPEMFVNVLIVYLSYKGDKNITIAYMDDEENSCDWCSDWNGNVIDAKVTHWMPLPEPPKEDDNG